jgi:hypothetical protein
MCLMPCLSSVERNVTKDGIRLSSFPQAIQNSFSCLFVASGLPEDRGVALLECGGVARSHAEYAEMAEFIEVRKTHRQRLPAARRQTGERADETGWVRCDRRAPPMA